MEIVPFVGANSCAMELEGFVSRWRTPSLIWSDNGTNFVAVEKEICKKIENWSDINIPAELARKGIKWRFNLPVVHAKVTSGRG